MWLVLGSAVAAVALVGGPYAYFRFVQGAAPAPLALSSPSVATAAQGSSGNGKTGTDGTWNVLESSVVGYRVDEVLFGQSHTATGRTSSITGSIDVKGATVASGSFTVDMTTVTSDESRRDAQFNGRIMETGIYPTAKFTLTKPIDFGSYPAQGVRRKSQATGNLTLHGVTKPVTFQVTTQRAGSEFQVAGSIPITFSDWNISNPSFAPVVTTQDHGILEFALNFAHA